MPKFYTTFNPKPVEAEEFRLPSETIPDQSMSIPEMIARFVRTGTLPVKSHADNGGNTPVEDCDPLDLQPEDAVCAFEAAKAELEKKKEPEKDPAPDPSPAPAHE